MEKHLVIVSFDAMVCEDLDLLKDGPVFSKFLNEGARVNRIRTIYPSLTYPAHTSMLTGARCGKHGIVNNEPSETGNLKCDWYWFHDKVRIPDIHDAAKKADLRTASVFWPVTGAHGSIDYLIAEYWAQGPEDTLEKAYKRAGTSDEVYDEIVKPVEKIIASWEPASSDDGKTEMACSIIRRYKPHILTLHLGQIDSFRHKNGVFNGKVAEGVMRSERYMQMIFDACRDAGILENTDFVICSDHGQINYSRRMNLNLLFVREGLIKTDEHGNITEWKAWAKSANFCAQVYLSDPAFSDRVHCVLKKACEAGDLGIGRVMTAKEARTRYGLYGDFSFVLESDESTLFSSKWTEPLFSPAESVRASHGNDPAVGPQPVFLGYGPSFRSRVVLSEGEIIDEAPTYARILGLELPDAEGAPMSALLNIS